MSIFLGRLYLDLDGQIDLLQSNPEYKVGADDFTAPYSRWLIVMKLLEATVTLKSGLIDHNYGTYLTPGQYLVHNPVLNVKTVRFEKFLIAINSIILQVFVIRFENLYDSGQ